MQHLDGSHFSCQCRVNRISEYMHAALAEVYF